MGTLFTSSCHPSAIREQMPTEAHSRIACVYCASLLPPFEVRGRSEHRCSDLNLIHEFLSPLSNQRTDAYGGSFENRMRILRELVTAVRSSWPERAPLFVRISATDWIERGWDIQQSIELTRQLRELGADLIDCSSGGNVPHAKIPVGPGYQTQFAEQIRRGANILTGAVGMITSSTQAEHILVTGQADAVVIAREFLRDPYWPLRAARELGQQISWPVQYLRAAPE